MFLSRPVVLLDLSEVLVVINARVIAGALPPSALIATSNSRKILLVLCSVQASAISVAPVPTIIIVFVPFAAIAGLGISIPAVAGTSTIAGSLIRFDSSQNIVSFFL